MICHPTITTTISGITASGGISSDNSQLEPVTQSGGAVVRPLCPPAIVSAVSMRRSLAGNSYPPAKTKAMPSTRSLVGTFCTPTKPVTATDEDASGCISSHHSHVSPALHTTCAVVGPFRQPANDKSVPNSAALAATFCPHPFHGSRVLHAFIEGVGA